MGFCSLSYCQILSYNTPIEGEGEIIIKLYEHGKKYNESQDQINAVLFLLSKRRNWAYFELQRVSLSYNVYIVK